MLLPRDPIFIDSTCDDPGSEITVTTAAVTTSKTSYQMRPGSYVAVANQQGSASSIRVRYRLAAGMQEAVVAAGSSINVAPTDGIVTLWTSTGTATAALTVQAISVSSVLYTPTVIERPEAGVVPDPAILSLGATVLNDWVLALAGGQGHTRGNVRCNRDQSGLLLIAIVPRGAAKPSASDPKDDEKYSVSPGDTYPLGAFASTDVDVWVRAGDDSAGLEFVAWGMIG